MLKIYEKMKPENLLLAQILTMDTNINSELTFTLKKNKLTNKEGL